MNATRRLAAIVLLGACGCAMSVAQMGGGATPKIAPGTLIEPAKTFDDMLTSFEKQVTNTAKAMPAEKYSFAPGAEIFKPGQSTDYKGVRTFAGQVSHLAQANYFIAMSFAAGSTKPDTDFKAIGELKDKDQLLAALAQSFAFAHKAVNTLTKENAFESVKETETRASMASLLVAHGFDHYGQMVEYLRMNGIEPPK